MHVDKLHDKEVGVDNDAMKQQKKSGNCAMNNFHASQLSVPTKDCFIKLHNLQFYKAVLIIGAFSKAQIIKWRIIVFLVALIFLSFNL